jgi:hypothetical protein
MSNGANAQRKINGKWSGRKDLNLRPPGPEPTMTNPHKHFNWFPLRGSRLLFPLFYLYPSCNQPNQRHGASPTPSRNQFTVKAASKKYCWPPGLVTVTRTGPEDTFGTVALSVMPSTKVVVAADVLNKTLAPL